MDTAIHYSRGAKVDGVDGQRPVNLTAPDFAAFADAVLADRQPRTPGNHTGKGPAWIACAFDPPRRLAVNALPRRWIGLDLDGGCDEVGFVVLCGILQRWSGFVYTSASHTREAPRARLILELDRPAPRDALIAATAAMRARIAAEMQREGREAPSLDPLCDKPEQPLFLPPEGAWAARYDGEPIVLAEILAEGLAETKAAPSAPVPGPTPAEILDPHRLAELRSALAAIPADDRTVWINVGLALYHLGDVGRELWETWSATSAKWRGAEDARRWDGFADSRSTYRAVFHRAQSHGWQNPMAKPVAQVAGASGPGTGRVPAPVAAAVPALRSMLVRYTPGALRTPPPPRRFVWDPFFPAGKVAILTGAGGTSKTGLMVRAMIGIALGEPVFDRPTTPTRCLYVTAEDTAEDLHRHLFECLRDRPDAADRVAERFTILDAAGRGLKLTRLVDGSASVTATAAELAALVGELGAGFLVLDTLSRLNGANEDTEGMARMIEAGEIVSRDTGAAVAILHHVSKEVARGGIVDQYVARGGGALSDNARSMLHLVAVTDPNDAPVPDAPVLVARRELLALHHVKANGPMLRAPIFLHRMRGEHAAVLVELKPIAQVDPNEAAWRLIADYLAATRAAVPYPTRQTIDTLSHIASRLRRRDALQWALDRGRARELPHPAPVGKGRTYIAVTDHIEAEAAAYRAAEDGA